MVSSGNRCFSHLSAVRSAPTKGTHPKGRGSRDPRWGGAAPTPAPSRAPDPAPPPTPPCPGFSLHTGQFLV